jgi:hypothetical protein
VVGGQKGKDSGQIRRPACHCKARAGRLRRLEGLEEKGKERKGISRKKAQEAQND